MAGDLRIHGRGHLERAVLAAEVVVRDVQADRRVQVFELLAETEREPREPLEEGPHGYHMRPRCPKAGRREYLRMRQEG